MIWTRVRGLHLNQAGIVPGELDLRRRCSTWRGSASRLMPAELKHPLCIYIPKSESAEEALWWRDVFQAIAKWRGLAAD